MQSKNAIGNLKNRYLAVLKKCNLLNVFGSLAVVSALTLGFGVSTAFAVGTNPEGTTVKSMDATDGSYQTPTEQTPALNSSTLINNGTISDGNVYNSLGNPFTAGMFGYHDTGDTNYFFANDGLIDIMLNVSTTNGIAQANSYGMYAYGNGNHELINNNTVTIENTATSTSSADADAYGMYAYGNGNHELINNNTVTIENTATSTSSADADAYGMYVYGNGTGHMLTNEISGIISITNEVYSENIYSHAYAYAYAIRASGTGNHELTNNGEIVINNIASSASGRAYSRANANAMHVDDNGNHKLINNGVITVSSMGSSANGAASAYASGMYIRAEGSHELINNGEIILESKAISTATSASDFVDATAIGMYANGDDNHTLTNSGIITVNSTGTTTNNNSDYAITTATGMSANGDGNHTLTNSAIITVSSAGTITKNNSYVAAYGMRVVGTASVGQSHILTNTGVINVKATATAGDGFTAKTLAYEAYGANSFTVDTWATTLRDWSANDAVFGLSNGNIITFANGDKGATLILRPDSSTVYDEEYYVANMVAIDADIDIKDDVIDMQKQEQFATGSIEGSIAEVITDVDFLTANLYNAGTNNPSVSLSKNAAANMPIQTITAQSLNTNLEHIKGVNDVSKNAIANIYNRAFGFEEIASANGTGLSAGSTAYSPWTVFATTYGSYTDNNEYSFDSGSYGVTGGITYNFNEQFALGGHLNFNVSSADSNNFDSDSNSFAFGAHSQYFINPNWYVSGSASFAFGDSDIEYTQSIGVAKDEFSSFSAFATLSTGYVYEINQNNIIVPEIGLSYLHAENDSYSLDFGAGNEIYKFDMHNNSYDNLYADLSLTWQGNYNLSSSTLSPSVGIGLRQNLTGSDIDASYDLFNTRFDTTVSSDDTTFLTNAGLKWTKNNFTVSADYEGEFGNEQTSHTGSLNFTFKF